MRMTDLKVCTYLSFLAKNRHIRFSEVKGFDSIALNFISGQGSNLGQYQDFLVGPLGQSPFAYNYPNSIFAYFSEGHNHKHS